jgi:hypothetical protein
MARKKHKHQSGKQLWNLIKEKFKSDRILLSVSMPHNLEQYFNNLDKQPLKMDRDLVINMHLQYFCRNM